MTTDPIPDPRQLADREDLLAEATALVERAELIIAGFDQPIVIGFRRDGCASVFFGAETAYHFNTQQQLRRAYLGGLLYKAERGQLASLQRRRTIDEVQLLRDDLSDVESTRLLQELQGRLLQLVRSLEAGEFEVTRQIPSDRDVVSRIRAWLTEICRTEIQIAASPRAI